MSQALSQLIFPPKPDEKWHPDGSPPHTPTVFDKRFQINCLFLNQISPERIRGIRHSGESRDRPPYAHSWSLSSRSLVAVMSVTHCSDSLSTGRVSGQALKMTKMGECLPVCLPTVRTETLPICCPGMERFIPVLLCRMKTCSHKPDQKTAMQFTIPL